MDEKNWSFSIVGNHKPRYLLLLNMVFPPKFMDWCSMGCQFWWWPCRFCWCCWHSYRPVLLLVPEPNKSSQPWHLCGLFLFYAVLPIRLPFTLRIRIFLPRWKVSYPFFVGPLIVTYPHVLLALWLNISGVRQKRLLCIVWCWDGLFVTAFWLRWDSLFFLVRWAS